MFTPPPREVLLAARSPAELFGAVALDARALRRAWAALARAFRAEDDPEAFQHARALYEAARDGDAAEAHPPDAPAPDDTHASPQAAAPRDDLAQQIQAALDARDPDVASALLFSRGDEIMVRYPIGGSMLVSALIAMRGPWLSADVLDHLQRLVGRGDVDLDPRFIRSVAFDDALTRAMHQARRGEQTAAVLALVALIEASWRKRADAVAESWLPLATPEALAALEGGLSDLERHHPTLLGQLRRRSVTIADAAAEQPPPEAPPELELWRDQLRPHRPDFAARSAAALSSWSGRVVTYLALCGLLLALPGRMPSLLLILLALALREVITSEAPGWVARIAQWLPPPPRPDPAALIAACRGAGWFPDDLIRALTPADPVPLSAPEASWEDDHPLLLLHADPLGVLRVLTPTHVARVAAAFRQEPSDA